MDNTPEAILAFAAKCAQEAWDMHQQPYMLARLSPDLAKEGINYKNVLGEQRLKDFVHSAPDRLKVVSHPSQKAKIGLIPPDRNFEFQTALAAAEDKVPSSSTLTERSSGSRRRYVVSNFLQLLSELDDADAAQVQIPVQILTKLMRDK